MMIVDLISRLARYSSRDGVDSKPKIPDCELKRRFEAMSSSQEFEITEYDFNWKSASGNMTYSTQGGIQKNRSDLWIRFPQPPDA